MAALNDWNVTDANNNATPPDGWPENTMQYSEVNDTGRAVQGTVRRFWGDVNGSLSAGGVADAYTLTLNESGYTAYFAGMYFSCVIPATNTGASTIDVNGIGVQSITDRAGNALTAGELQSGGIYEFRYDGTQFQLMGTVAGQVSIPQATLTNSNQIDLVDTDVALRVGAADPDTAQHLELDLDGMQSKSDATTAAAMSLNPFGGAVQIGAQSGTGGVQLWDDGIERFITAANGEVHLQNNSNADPTVPDPFAAEYQFRSQDGNEYGFIGYPSSSTLRLFNRAHGGSIDIRMETAAGAGIPKAVFSETNIQFFGDDAGNEAFRVLANTVRTFTDIVTATPPTTEAVTGGYDIVDQDTTDFLMRSGFFASNQWELINNMHGGNLRLAGENAAGTQVNFATFDPDGVQVLRGPSNWVFSPDQDAAFTLLASDHAVNLVSTTNNDILEWSLGVNEGVNGRRARFFLDDDAGTFGLQGSASSGVPTFELVLGTSALAMQAVSGGATALYNNNTRRFETQSTGICAILSNANTDTENRRLDLEYADGTLRGFMGFNSNDILQLSNEIHGGNVRLVGEDGGGTNRTMVDCDPDNDVALFDIGVEVARTLPAASGGFEVNNTSTGAGFERVLTTSDLGGGATIESAVSTANVDRQNTTTLAADPDLVVSTLTTEVYRAECVIGWNVTVNNAQGFRMNFTGTGHVGMTSFDSNSIPSTGTHEFGVMSGTTYISANIVNGNTNYYLKGMGTGEGLTDPDTVTFQWAQRLNNANRTRRLDNSWISYLQVS